VQLTFWSKYVLKLLSPIILGVAMCLFLGVTSLIQRASLKLWIKNIQNHMIGLILLFCTAMYPLLVSTASSPFKCRRNGNAFMMVDLPSFQCFSSEWWRLFPMIFFFLFLYGIVLPCGLIWLFWSHSGEIRTEEFQKKFCNITTAYKDRFYFWELVHVAKRSAFVLSATFFSVAGDEANDLFFAICTVFCFFVTEMSLEPYLAEQPFILSKVYSLFLLMALIFIFCSFRTTIVQIVLLVSNGALFKSDVSELTNSVFGALMIFLVCCIILTLIYYMIHGLINSQAMEHVKLKTMNHDALADMVLGSTMGRTGGTVDAIQDVIVDHTTNKKQGIVSVNI
jgi:ABC-type multidrug transport system fused ATPase/permease subunit